MPTTLATLLPLPARTGESKDPLRFEQICAWRGTLPEGHRFEATLALRQVLSRAVAWELIDVNPAKRGVSNPLRRFPEKRPFESWAEIAAIADRLGPVGGAMITFAAATGLRPAELVALEERDVDHLGGVVYVRRQLVRGQVRPTKTPRSMRPVPLQSVALEALERLPESESPLLFPSPRGGYFDRHYRHLARDGREHAVALFDAFAKETAAWTPGGRRNGHRKPARAKGRADRIGHSFSVLWTFRGRRCSETSSSALTEGVSVQPLRVSCWRSCSRRSSSRAGTGSFARHGTITALEHAQVLGELRGAPPEPEVETRPLARSDALIPA